MSATAKSLRRASIMFHDGFITAEEKAILKSRILRQGENGVGGVGSNSSNKGPSLFATATSGGGGGGSSRSSSARSLTPSIDEDNVCVHSSLASHAPGLILDAAAEEAVPPIPTATGGRRPSSSSLSRRGSASLLTHDPPLSLSVNDFAAVKRYLTTPLDRSRQGMTKCYIRRPPPGSHDNVYQLFHEELGGVIMEGRTHKGWVNTTYHINMRGGPNARSRSEADFELGKVKPHKLSSQCECI
jgi:hypothetical protein